MNFDMENFKEIVSSFHERLLAVPVERTSIVLGPDKWSLKEIVGHLIDSASNNQQRFVRLQEERSLSLPGYNQENWIRIQRYNSMNWKDLVSLWRLMNSLLLHIIEGIPGECLEHTYQSPDGPVSLEWLVNDYFRHLRDHVKHFEKRYSEL
ncbi:MAG: DinB family protein [Syntrophobacter sp.]